MKWSSMYLQHATFEFNNGTYRVFQIHQTVITNSKASKCILIRLSQIQMALSRCPFLSTQMHQPEKKNIYTPVLNYNKTKKKVSFCIENLTGQITLGIWLRFH